MRTEFLEYGDRQLIYEAYVAYDEAWKSRRSCVLILHAWAGQGEFERQLARELVTLGYVGVAVDVYGKTVRGDPLGDNGPLMRPLIEDRSMLLGRLHQALAFVRQHPFVDPDRVAALGHCFGGLCALDLARSGAPGVLGVVSFHGLLHPPQLRRPVPITAKVLILHGYDDPFAPPADVQALAQELTAARADWQLHAYGGVMHQFTSPEANKPELGILYDARAARRSWAAMNNFLNEVL